MSGPYSFAGKRALVTGAGAGIGRATAKRLVELGAEVVALSKTDANLKTLQEECPKIQTVCVDLADWDATRTAVEKLTPFHLLVNNAGIGHVASFLEAKQEDMDKLFSVHVKAVMNVSQVVVSDLLARGLKGTIVNVSSQAAKRALLHHSVYGCTKAAVDMLTQVMALELGSKGIRVNSVCPTVVMTDMARRFWSPPERAEPMLARIPQKRFAEVEDVVRAITYLLSDASDMVHGHALPVDGGFLIT
ncbi:L-xylulose reductase-like [Oratosquilla oratoria]|uniref:L-xylulose reductase-like n=1 Tax=Oratosquilla oratoria TaxID=337810 RepID=UPI003F76CEFB